VCEREREREKDRERSRNFNSEAAQDRVGLGGKEKKLNAVVGNILLPFTHMLHI
jgi:hypothetical protein